MVVGLTAESAQAYGESARQKIGSGEASRASSPHHRHRCRARSRHDLHDRHCARVAAALSRRRIRLDHGQRQSQNLPALAALARDRRAPGADRGGVRRPGSQLPAAASARVSPHAPVRRPDRSIARTRRPLRRRPSTRRSSTASAAASMAKPWYAMPTCLVGLPPHDARQANGYAWNNVLHLRVFSKRDPRDDRALKSQAQDRDCQRKMRSGPSLAKAREAGGAQAPEGKSPARPKASPQKRRKNPPRPAKCRPKPQMPICSRVLSDRLMTTRRRKSSPSILWAVPRSASTPR